MKIKAESGKRKAEKNPPAVGLHKIHFFALRPMVIKIASN
jgi:hypothetical protein